MAMENPEQEKNKSPKSEETNTAFFELGFVLLVSLLTIVLFAYALMFAWNDFAVELFGAKQMTFTNALALLTLRYIFIGSLNPQSLTKTKK